MMHGFDYSEFEEPDQALLLLPGAMNHILGLDEGKKRFLDVMAAISKAYTLCGTMDEAYELKKNRLSISY